MQNIQEQIKAEEEKNSERQVGIQVRTTIVVAAEIVTPAQLKLAYSVRPHPSVIFFF
jgi:hypothetical protein